VAKIAKTINIMQNKQEIMEKELKVVADAQIEIQERY